jgi:hypothetical protein
LCEKANDGSGQYSVGQYLNWNAEFVDRVQVFTV